MHLQKVPTKVSPADLGRNFLLQVNFLDIQGRFLPHYPVGCLIKWICYRSILRDDLHGKVHHINALKPLLSGLALFYCSGAALPRPSIVFDKIRRFIYGCLQDDSVRCLYIRDRPPVRCCGSVPFSSGCGWPLN